MTVKVSRRKNGDEVLLEPWHSLTTEHITAAKCLVKVTDGKAVLRLINPTNRNVKIGQDLILASVSDIHSSEVYPLVDDNIPLAAAVDVPNHGTSNQNDISFDLTDSDLSDSQKQELLNFLNNHRSNFATDLSQLGKTSEYKHRIEIKPGSRPVRLPFYRTSLQNEKEMSRQIDEMETHGIIKPSNSEWHSPVVLVRKKNNTYRFACDYRALNKITVPNSFPLPHIESVFDAIGAAKANFFTNLDLMSGFWQMELDEESRKKAAFITQRGVYEWTRMPFGLTNAPISFQTLMSTVLRGLNWKSVLVYVDDILIFSNSFQEHLHHLEQVFNRLREAKLTLQPNKCHFAVKQLKFLGHIISRRGIEVDPDKTRAVSDFPVPKTQKHVRSFLGMANYYRRFIKDFSQVAAPLNALLRKDVKFRWTQGCQNAFDALKSKLISAPILSYPDPTKRFILTCDASDTAVGYVLGQLDSQNREHVIAFGGKSLTPDQKKYNTTEKECLAVLCGIDAYRPYLTHGEFEIVTDHKALVWLKTAKHTGVRLERWALKLQEYNFKMTHRPGKSNSVADALSRREYDDSTENTKVSDLVQEVFVAQQEVDDTEDENEGTTVTFCYAADAVDQTDKTSKKELTLRTFRNRVRTFLKSIGI